MEHKHIHDHHCECHHKHHEHHHEHKEECGCGHHHEHHHEHKEECGCGHHHEHHHEHKEECCCGHHHEHHHEHKEERTLKKADYKFLIKNLDCANCARKIEEAVNNLNEVEEAVLNFSSQVLLVKSKCEETKLLKMINDVAGKIEYGVLITNSKTEEKTSHKSDIIQIILGLLLFFTFIYAEYKSIDINLLLYLGLYLVVAYKVIFKAVHNIMKKDFFDENFLMMIASIGAFITQSYEEAIAVMLFYDIGELLQSLAVEKSRASIKDLMDLDIEEVTLYNDEKEVIIKSEDIKINDLILVKAGERVAVDGIVVSGSSMLDMSSLSGESLPKNISKDDEVLAGSLNMNGVFALKALKTVNDSTVAKIHELVENASMKKAKIERFITRFAKVYTPFVVFLALLVVVVPPLLNLGDFTTWLYRGCTFLVISCPCALVISIPLGLFAGIGASSKVGVLVKGASSLEQLSKLDTILFDKTGTISKAQFKISEVNGHEDTLKLAAMAENYSNHPLAKCISKAYKCEETLENVVEVAGEGIVSIYHEKTLLVGNSKLLNRHHIIFEESNTLGSIVYVAYDNKYYGYIVIEDEIKENVGEVITSLKSLGISKCVLLSGDKKEVVEKIGKQLHIDEMHGELLPQDKVHILESYLDENHVVGFVGDGINDAPVLMRSDLGIAMGGIGSDAAIEASDIVLMNDDLNSIVSAIKIANKTKTILWENIIFSLLIKFIVLLLALFGIANMWLGVFADVGVTILAILNAMRALKQ